AAGGLYRDRDWRSLMLEKPEVWGAQELSSKEVTMRIVAKTEPMQQWEVARELRARVKSALDGAGVVPAGPDTIIITAPERGPLGEAGPPGEAEPAAAGETSSPGAPETTVVDPGSESEPAP
ncbi:MAG: hypothetical protein ACRDPY_30610, partial [Streptosporangiaceae bacterium]